MTANASLKSTRTLVLDLREDLESVLFVPQLPDLKDAEAVQKFFLEEIQHGEELLAQGKASS